MIPPLPFQLCRPAFYLRDEAKRFHQQTHLISILHVEVVIAAKNEMVELGELE